MRHSRWIDQCARNLAMRAEYPTDCDLMTYLQAQSFVHKTQVMLEEDLSDHLIHNRQVAWERVFKLMEKEKIEERLLSCQGSNDNCKYLPRVPIYLRDLTRDQGLYALSSVLRIYFFSVTLFDGRGMCSIFTR